MTAIPRAFVMSVFAPTRTRTPRTGSPDPSLRSGRREGEACVLGRNRKDRLRSADPPKPDARDRRARRVPDVDAGPPEAGGKPDPLEVPLLGARCALRRTGPAGRDCLCVDPAERGDQRVPADYDRSARIDREIRKRGAPARFVGQPFDIAELRLARIEAEVIRRVAPQAVPREDRRSVGRDRCTDCPDPGGPRDISWLERPGCAGRRRCRGIQEDGGLLSPPKKTRSPPSAVRIRSAAPRAGKPVTIVCVSPARPSGRTAVCRRPRRKFGSRAIHAT
jgi:hypothetical protein